MNTELCTCQRRWKPFVGVGYKSVYAYESFVQCSGEMLPQKQYRVPEVSRVEPTASVETQQNIVRAAKLK